MILGVHMHFDAAHFLPYYDGQCRDLHGHTYHVEVQLSGFPMVSGSTYEGMIMDFKVFKQHVKDVLDQLDHKCLNDVLPDMPTTCENTAQWIKSQLTKSGLNIKSVTVQEGEGGFAIAD